MKKILEFSQFINNDPEAQLEEPKIQKSRTFIYTVYDESEDGFSADVRGTDGSIVYELKGKKMIGEDEDKPMKDVNDMKGLRSLLIAKGLVHKEDILTKNEVYQNSEEIVQNGINTNMIEAPQAIQMREDRIISTFEKFDLKIRNEK